MIFRTSGNVDSVHCYEIFREFIRIIFEKAEKIDLIIYTSEWDQWDQYLNGINISECHIFDTQFYALPNINNFKLLSPLRRSDCWRPSVTAPN